VKFTASGYMQAKNFITYPNNPRLITWSLSSWSTCLSTAWVRLFGIYSHD